jgi:hypothetical protein
MKETRKEAEKSVSSNAGQAIPTVFCWLMITRLFRI